MILATLALRNRARNLNWSAQCQYNVTGWYIMSSVWGGDISVRQHSKTEH